MNSPANPKTERKNPNPAGKKIVRVRPGAKVRPSAESLEQLRRVAEEKGWTRKSE